VDVVLLATRPASAPSISKAAVEAGKHVFCENRWQPTRQVWRSVAGSAEVARKKNLALVAGFCWRYEERAANFTNTFTTALSARFAPSTPITKPAASSQCRPSQPGDGMGDLEWQMRNWYNFRLVVW